MTNKIGSLPGAQIMIWVAFGMALLMLYGAIFHDFPNDAPREKVVIKIDSKTYTCTQGVK